MFGPSHDHGTKYAMLISEVMQALTEASFMYSQSNVICVAFKQVRGGYPSIVFFSDERNSIAQTDQLTVMTVAVRKLTAEFKLYGWRDDQTEKKGVLATDDIKAVQSALYTPDRMVANRPLFHKYPEFFKFQKLEGRAMIFRHLTTDLHMTEMTFRKFFGEPPELTQGTHYQEFHKARLFFPEAMREARKQALLAMLEEVRQFLVNAGLERVFSGDIRFVKQKSRAAGLYYLDTKDMRIEPDVNNSKAVVYALLHEFGHKHYYEFLPEEQHRLVAQKYYELRRAGVRFEDASAEDRKAASQRLIPGAKLKYIGKTRKLRAIGEFEVVPSKRYGKISIKGGDATFTGDPDAFLTQDWQLVGDEQGIAVSSGTLSDNFNLVSSSWFPTKYSETSYTEWYAECFAIFVLKHLEGEPGAWFSHLIA